MGTLFDGRDRASVLARIARLTPESRPRWGSFTAPEMVCHVSSALRQGLGELSVGTPRGPFTRTPINWLVIHVLPWPKGKGKSPAEFLAVRPTTLGASSYIHP